MSKLTRNSLFTGRAVSSSVIRRLSLSLNQNNAYKDLACEIKKRNSTECKFSSDSMSNISSKNNPSLELLNAWMTDAPTLSEVISTLDKVQLIRQANIIRTELLGEPPMEPIQKKTLSEDATNRIETGEQSSNGIIENFQFITDSPVRYRFETLAAWTDGFNEDPVSSGGRILGEGGFARVYLGHPTSEVSVAIKKLNSTTKDASNEKQFHTEISTLSKNKHKNILGILGYCDSLPHNCIVYPYMKNGSLDKCLSDSKRRCLLTARVRTLIAAESAEGICHLHSLGLIHRDIKSANLLLDDHFTVKVGDCGLVQLVSGFSPSKTHTVATSVIGTPVYMPPEYIQYGEVSPKLDAYSYGVILLELLTGLPAFDESREEVGLPDYVEENLETDGTLKSAVVDPSAGDWPSDVVQTLFKLSQTFLENKRKSRRTISEDLSQIIDLCSSFS